MRKENRDKKTMMSMITIDGTTIVVKNGSMSHMIPFADRLVIIRKMTKSYPVAIYENGYRIK